MQTIKPKAGYLESGYYHFGKLHSNLSAEQLHAEFRLNIRSNCFLCNAGDVFAYFVGQIAARNGMRVRA